MSLEQWSVLGEIAGALAVIATLVFVGRQMRQFTDAMRAQTRPHFASSRFELSNLKVGAQKPAELSLAVAIGAAPQASP